MQIVPIECNGVFEDVILPDPDYEVLPGVRLGRADALLSPAHWVIRCRVVPSSFRNFANRYGTLAEEIGFCLLGGYGITAELATAYFQLLHQERIFEPSRRPSEATIYNALTKPIDIGGHRKRYRFPRQRARRIALAMEWLNTNVPNTSDPKRFRSELQTLEGVGLKTASWIARNWLDTDEVAIIDIHVLRAGWAIGLFEQSVRLPHDYMHLEDRFLTFARNLNVRSSILDAVIWSDMRTYGSKLLRSLDPQLNTAL